jgi:hypothetical protein
MQGARRGPWIVRTLQQARHVQMLLREASTWAVGSFWEAVRPGARSARDNLHRGRSPDLGDRLMAARDGVARLVRDDDARAAEWQHGVGPMRATVGHRPRLAKGRKR